MGIHNVSSHLYSLKPLDWSHDSYKRRGVHGYDLQTGENTVVLVEVSCVKLASIQQLTLTELHSRIVQFSVFCWMTNIHTTHNTSPELWGTAGKFSIHVIQQLSINYKISTFIMCSSIIAASSLIVFCLSLLTVSVVQFSITLDRYKRNG